MLWDWERANWKIAEWVVVYGVTEEREEEQKGGTKPLF